MARRRSDSLGVFGVEWREGLGTGGGKEHEQALPGTTPAVQV